MTVGLVKHQLKNIKANNEEILQFPGLDAGFAAPVEAPAFAIAA